MHINLEAGMRDLILFNAITLDGFFEGPGNDLSWHRVDDEFNKFAWEQIRGVDAIMFGRKTYELMASYWPTPESAADDPVTAELMNIWPKIVFSRTLKDAAWNNTHLVNNAVDEVRRLKEHPGKPLIIFGSANLSTSLMKAGLIDQFNLMVMPVVLGNGTPLFQGINSQLNLTLAGTRAFANGNVLLTYRKS
jgi:dihydrofolate reductase